MEEILYSLTMSTEVDNSSLAISKEIRREVIKFVNQHKIAHLGSCLSVVDILTVLFFKILRNYEPNNYSIKSDQLILSKGHAAVSLYLCLLKKGFIRKSNLDRFGMSGSIYEEHPNPNIPTVLSATGSLGHGLAFANGLALANKSSGNLKSRIYVLMSDGECNEGTVWESAIFSSSKNLSQITVLIDHNKFQATGPISDTLGKLSLSKMFEAMGWETFEIDGHDLNMIESLLTSNISSSKPIAIICHTIKGKGVSFMENNNNWHYKAPNNSEMEIALKELL
jgi:transketolase